MNEFPPVLDPCCGTRGWWFDKDNPAALFCDLRRETVTVTDRSHGKVDGRRTLSISPDLTIDFRDMPFPDNTFHLVAFDPPHLVRAGRKSWLASKYGTLGPSWRDDLRSGFSECLRVLRPFGTLVFKWNEAQIPIRDVLPLCPIAPMFRATGGRHNGTHTIIFLKPQS